MPKDLEYPQVPFRQDGYARLREVATFLGVSRAMVHKIMNRGELEYIRVGGGPRISCASVHRYVEANRVGAETSSNL